MRWVKCPPVDTCRTHVDQASPALSNRVMAAVPRVLAAAMVSKPPVTSSNGLARRVSAIRAPAATTPPTATAAVIGSSHCWMLLTAGSAARSGDGICTHQVAVSATIHLTPAMIARAIPPSTPPAAAPVTVWSRCPAARQAGSINVLQCMVIPRWRRWCSRSATRHWWRSWPNRHRAEQLRANHRGARGHRSGSRRARGHRWCRAPR